MPGLEVRLAPAGQETAAKVIRLSPGELLRDSIAQHLEPPGWDDVLVLYDVDRGRMLEPAEAPEDQRITAGDLILVGEEEELEDPLASYKDALEDMKDAPAWPPPDEQLSAAASMRQALKVDWDEHLRLARRAGFDEDEARLIFEAKPSIERQHEEYAAIAKLIARSLAPPAPPGPPRASAAGAKGSSRARARAAKNAAKGAAKGATPDASPSSAPRPVDANLVKRLLRLKETLGISDGKHTQVCRAVGLTDAQASALLGSGGAGISGISGDREYRAALIAAKDAQYDPGSLGAIRQLIRDHSISREAHTREATAIGLDMAAVQGLYDDRLDRPPGWRFYQTALLTAADRPDPTEEEIRDLSAQRRRYGIREALHTQICNEHKVLPRRAAVLLGDDGEGGGPGIPLTRLMGLAVIIAMVIVLSTQAGRTVAAERLADLRRMFIATDRYGPDGFDEDGFDKDGRDRQGFDRQGRDRVGYDRQGFARDGFNREGRDRDGYDRHGFGRDGFNREGRDRDGFDRMGFDKRGLDRKGRDRDGFDKNGIDATGFNRMGFDRQGYDKDGYDKDGFGRDGLDRRGFDRHGLNKLGLSKDGRDKDGFDRNGLDRNGYNRKGYNKDGFDRKGFDKNGRDRDGYDQHGRDRDGYDRKGFDPGGYNRSGFNAQGLSKDGLTKDGFDKNGRDAEGYDREGYNAGGFNRLGRDRQGLDREGRDHEGFDKTGHDKNGFDREGFGADGFDRQGYDKEGFDRKGFNHSGYDRAGFDGNGYTREGFGKNGDDLLPIKLRILESPSGYQLVNGSGPPLIVGQRVGPQGVVLVGIAPSSVRFTFRDRTYERSPSR